MDTVVLGNIVSFAASAIMVLIGLIGERRKILLTQCAQFALFSASNIILGGYSGAIANIVSIIRNLRFLKKGDISLFEKLIYIAVQAVLTAIFNTLGLIGWLPVLSAVLLTVALGQKHEVGIKTLFIITTVLWAIFDLTIRNYVSCVFDLFTVISNLIGIFAIKRTLRERAERDEKRKQNPDF